MRVAMIGAGYVGLVSGACFADFGHQVTVIDKDAKRVAALHGGEIPIFEPGLADLVEANIRAGPLEYAVDTRRAADADAVFIAVGTPSRRGDGHADLSRLRRRARDRDQFSPARRSWSPNRRFQSAPAMRSNASCATGVRMSRSRLCPTRNCCARAPPSRISSTRPHRGRH
jgi:2-polyprenyl-6-methoxyphenol hydroxylase-like FAD-dependent oxidoreductase